MALKVLSHEATMRMMNFMRDGIPPPQKIVEHKERMEAMLASCERRRQPQDPIDQVEVRGLLDIRYGLEALYTSWAEDVERVRWMDIPDRDDITPEIVVRECSMSTESYFGNVGVEVLAVYLDACGYDRLLFRLAEACTLRVREYLALVVPKPVYDTTVLDKPAECYGTTNPDVLRDRLVDRFILFVNRNSPQHIIRALIANIAWGSGNYVHAIDEAGFAYCEATVEQFGLKLHIGHPDVEKAFTDWELWKAARLLEFLK